MAENVLMNNDFLKNSITTTYSSDKKTVYYKVDLTPGYVPYKYQLSHGTFEGCWCGKGIYRGSNLSFVGKVCIVRGGMWEGVRLTEASWKKNGGAWNDLESKKTCIDTNNHKVTIKGDIVSVTNNNIAAVGDSYIVAENSGNIAAVGNSYIVAKPGSNINIVGDSYIISKGYSNINVVGDATIITDGTDNIRVVGRATIIYTNSLVNEVENPIINLSSTRNGDTFEVKATYELWSQGFPHRDIPFMWFSDSSTSNYYNNRNNCFTDSVPHNPGNFYAGIEHPYFTSNGWELVSVTWNQPANNCMLGHWFYWNGTQKYGGSIINNCCQRWISGMPYNHPDDGWTGYESGRKPNCRRRSIWWRFRKNYYYKWTVNGIYEKPDPKNVPTGSLTVYNNLTTTQNNVYNGEKGIIQVSYYQAQNNSGWYSIWATQLIDGQEIETCIANKVSINNSESRNIVVDFKNFNLRRSHEIKYRLHLGVEDPDWNTTRIREYYGGSWNNKIGSHYFNEEPPRPNNVWIDDVVDRTREITIHWDNVIDPDWSKDNIVKYHITIWRSLKDNPYRTAQYKSMTYDTYSERQYSYCADYYTTNNSLTIPTNMYYYGENISITVCPYDGYTNSYYYAREISATINKDINVELTTISNLTNKDSNNIYSGEHGTIQIKYTHKFNKEGTVKVYAMYSIQQSSGFDTGYFCNNGNEIYSSTFNANETKNIQIDFKNLNIPRAKYIKYFAIATDDEGNESYIPLSKNDTHMWGQINDYHYFNDIPTAVTPYISENYSSSLEEAFMDDILEIAWPNSTDKDGDSIGYRLYIEEVDNPNNKTKKFYTSTGRTIDNYNDKNTILNDNYSMITRSYTEMTDLGYISNPTSISPYKLNITKYLGKNIRIFIETYDKYNSDYYRTGEYLAADVEIKPEVPRIELSTLSKEDLLGNQTIDGDNGYITVTHTHPKGRSATVVLNAKVTKIESNKATTVEYFENIVSWNISSGYSSPKTKLNFSNLFGEDLRGSIIEYYAVATTAYGECSDDNWNINDEEANKNKWVGNHYYNAQPKNVNIYISDVNNETNFHSHVVIRWNKAIDIDNINIEPTYAIVLAVESNKKKYINLTYGENKENDIPQYYTKIWNTSDLTTTIDLSEYDEGENFKLWVIPHDNFANNFYYTSNTLEFSKARYGKPIINYELTQNHSEYGTLKITYTHEDVEYKDGEYISKDPDRFIEQGDFDAYLDIYCYCNNSYNANYNTLRNQKFTIGETKTFTIPFDKVSPYRRSLQIRYYLKAHDILSGKYNYDDEPDNVSPDLLTNSYHYYNDEPYDTIIEIGEMDKKEDKYIYEFDYINLQWYDSVEPDNDEVIYYLYIKTPERLNEPNYRTTIIGRQSKLENIEYNRKYKVIKIKSGNEFKYTQVSYYEEDTKKWIEIQKNNFLGIKINYKNDHLGKEWPEKEEYTMYMECRDNRNWENSYYGMSSGIYKYYRRRHLPPNLVQLDVIPNLETTNNGEAGKINVLYTHPEGDIDGRVNIYAYQDGKFKCKVHEGLYCNGVPQTAEIYFTDFELDKFDDIDDASQLMRSKSITYFAEAIDTLVGYSSLLDYSTNKEIVDCKTIDILDLDLIPLLEKDDDGKYPRHIINFNEEVLDFNDEDGHYIGPVQTGYHYFNEEPPSVSIKEYDPENIVSYNTSQLKWENTIDPDGDDVSYELYVRSSDNTYNSHVEVFYNDDYKFKEKEQTIILDEDGRIATEDTTIYATGMISYSKKIDISASLAKISNTHYTVPVEEYPDDSQLDFWLVSKDPYLNSYYRAGEILTVIKGHEARDIREVYPCNDSIVYNPIPRILIYLGEDNQRQTTYVGWNNKEYNNKDNPEYFSDIPNTKNVIVFKAPVPISTTHNSSISYYVYAHNQSTYSDKKYITYTYKNFSEEFGEDVLIPIKSHHVNTFRTYCNNLRFAYGFEDYNFTREIKKNQAFENYDFNETKNSLTEINDLINNADPTPNFDYINDLIIDVDDLELVEYEGKIGTSSYREFLEWARLLYLLENM